jgi:hypothetical protein
MRLSAIKRGRTMQPPRLLLHGAPKIGKSAFVSTIPDAIVLGYEPGAYSWDVASFRDDEGEPIVFSAWAETVDAINALLTEEHEFRVVAVDTLDWLEAAVEAEACRRIGIKSLADQAYGNGYAAMSDVWREFTALLNRLIGRGMGVCLLAHTEVKRYSPPNGEAYDVQALKMSKKGGEIMREWAGIIGYARQPVAVSESRDKRKVSRFRGDREILLDAENPGVLAGNQHGMTGTCELDWSSFIAAYAAAHEVK